MDKDYIIGMCVHLKESPVMPCIVDGDETAFPEANIDENLSCKLQYIIVVTS